MTQMKCAAKLRIITDNRSASNTYKRSGRHETEGNRVQITMVVMTQIQGNTDWNRRALREAAPTILNHSNKLSRAEGIKSRHFGRGRLGNRPRAILPNSSHATFTPKCEVKNLRLPPPPPDSPPIHRQMEDEKDHRKEASSNAANATAQERTRAMPRALTAGGSAAHSAGSSSSRCRRHSCGC